MNITQRASTSGSRTGRFLAVFFACAALALVLAPTAARAGDEGDPDSYRSFDVGDGKLSLDFFHLLLHAKRSRFDALQHTSRSEPKPDDGDSKRTHY